MNKFIPFILLPFVVWGVWKYLKKKNDFSPLKKRTLAWAIGCFSLTEVVRSFFRPYIYDNKINDFHFSDTVGNSFGTMAVIFFLLTISGIGTAQDWKMVGIIIIGLMGYELFNWVKFDINDIIATIIFGFVSIIIYARILQKYGKSTFVEKND